MIAILVGVFIALIFLVADSAEAVTTKDKERLAYLTGVQPGDIPENKADILLRLARAKIWKYVMITVGMVALIIIVGLLRSLFPVIPQIIPKRR